MSVLQALLCVLESLVLISSFVFAESSAIIQMQSYVAASAPVIMYVDKLFLSRELGIDW